MIKLELVLRRVQLAICTLEICVQLLFEFLIAKHEGGDFLLRIEDTDQERKVEGAVDVIYKTLKECGLNWDEGPDIGGDFGPYVQSDVYLCTKGRPKI